MVVTTTIPWREHFADKTGSFFFSFMNWHTRRNLAQAIFSAQQGCSLSFSSFFFAIGDSFEKFLLPTGGLKVSGVTYVAKNKQRRWRVLAPGMEVKEAVSTYEEAVGMVQAQKDFNRQRGVPVGLSEGLSRLALVAHMFNGCEVGFKAQELRIKSLSTRTVNTAPSEALLVELGVPSKGDARDMVLQRLASIQNVVLDDDGPPEVVALGAGAPLRVERENPGAARVKEEPGAAHVKEDPGALLRAKREKSGVTLKYLEELHGVDILCVDTPSSASPASSSASTSPASSPHGPRLCPYCQTYDETAEHIFWYFLVLYQMETHSNPILYFDETL